jgi:hypothetical protein
LDELDNYYPYFDYLEVILMDIRQLACDHKKRKSEVNNTNQGPYIKAIAMENDRKRVENLILKHINDIPVGVDLKYYKMFLNAIPWSTNGKFNRQKILEDYIVKCHHFNNNHTVVTQLNGNNGEATNGDDFDSLHVHPVVIKCKEWLAHKRLATIDIQTHNCDKPGCLAALDRLIDKKVTNEIKTLIMVENDFELFVDILKSIPYPLREKTILKAFRKFHDGDAAFLNGINGEWTGLDDMPKNKKGNGKKRARDQKQDTKIQKLQQKVQQLAVSKVPRVPRMNKIQWRFLLALNNPFDQRAIGCKVPDLSYDPHASTSMLSGRFTVVNTANGGGFISSPAIHMTLIDPSRLNGGAQSAFITEGFAAYTANASIYQLEALTTMKDYCSAFRIVAGGIKIMNAAATTVAPTRVKLNKCNIGNAPVGKNFLDNIGITDGADFTSMYLGTNSTSAGVFVGQSSGPKCAFTNQDIIASCIVSNCKPTEPNAHKWQVPYTTTNTFTATTTSGDMFTETTATGAILSTDYRASCDNSGWEAILQSFNGPNAGTTYLDVEVALHIEYLDSPNTSGFNVNHIMGNGVAEETANVWTQLTTYISKAVDWKQMGSLALNTGLNLTKAFYRRANQDSMIGYNSEL